MNYYYETFRYESTIEILDVLYKAIIKVDICILNIFCVLIILLKRFQCVFVAYILQCFFNV